MDFNNDEDIMKAIMNGGTGNSKDIEEELAKLEADSSDVKEKKCDEGNLSDLEREIDNEEEKYKEKQNLKPKKPDKDPDMYTEKTEQKYHSIDKMICLTSLERETELCNKIIRTKKKIGADYHYWDTKKKCIKSKIQEINSLVEGGTWNLDIYKTKIKEQYQWEEQLLIFVEKDPELNDQQKKIIKDRINERKKIIEEELKNSQEEENNDEPKEEALNKEEYKNEESKDNDLYPENVDIKYHSVEKMTCLGALEKEKELCDKIIEYKKKIGADYNYWDTKKESIDDKIQEITDYVNEGKWDLDAYKIKIKEQYQWEEKLLNLVENDLSLNDQQKKVIKCRINERKKNIEGELSQGE